MERLSILQHGGPQVAEARKAEVVKGKTRPSALSNLFGRDGLFCQRHTENFDLAN